MKNILVLVIASLALVACDNDSGRTVNTGNPKPDLDQPDCTSRLSLDYELGRCPGVVFEPEEIPYGVEPVESVEE